MAFKMDINTQWNGKDIKIKGKKVVNQTSYGVGLAVEGQAALLAPRDTGLLAGSITTQAFDKGSEPRAPASEPDIIRKPDDQMVVHVGTAVEYAADQEFGTIKQDAQPFLRPALDLAQGKVLTIGQAESKFIFKDYLQ